MGGYEVQFEKMNHYIEILKILKKDMCKNCKKKVERLLIPLQERKMKYLESSILET